MPEGGQKKYSALIFSVLGCALGFVLAVGIEFAIFSLISEMSGSKLVPRGAGWIVFPFGGAAAGWKIGQQIGSRNIDFSPARKPFAIVTGASLSWLLILSCYIILVNPFDEYEISNNWYFHAEKLLEWTFIPPLLLATIYGISLLVRKNI